RCYRPTIIRRGSAAIQRRSPNYSENASLLRPDPELLDERPPLLRIGLHKRTERLGCLPLARDNVHAEIGDPGSRRRIGQRSYGRRIELADDVLRRAPGREKPGPAG